MKPVEFRIWDAEYNEMLSDGKDGMYMSQHGSLVMIQGTFRHTVSNDIKGCVVLFYSGMNDRTDKPIYEGDLLSLYLSEFNSTNSESSGVYEVIFEDAMFKLKVIKKNWFDTSFISNGEAQKLTIDPFCPAISITKLPLYRFTSCNIIGNIYENKELLA